MKPCLLTFLLACVAFFSFAQTISSDSLVLWVPFSGDARDQSGNNYHGVVNGASLTTGAGNLANSAYYFNGVNSSIVFPNLAKLDGPLTAFTLLVRLQPYDVNADGTTTPPFINTYNFLTWHRNATDSAQAFLHSKLHTAFQPPAPSSAPGLNFLSYLMEWCNVSGTASGYSRDSSEINNRWLTVAYVYNAGTVDVYHNCQRMNHWTNYPAVSELCGTEPVQISLGNVPQGVMQYGYRYFKGKMDELRVYKRALSEAEIQRFADSLCRTPPAPLRPLLQMRPDPCYPNRILFLNKSDTLGFGYAGCKWNLSSGDSAAADSFQYTFTRPGTYTARLTVYTANGTYTKDTAFTVASVGARKFLSLSSAAETVCRGRSFGPQLAGGTRYQWQPCLYLNDCTAAGPVISPAGNVAYTVTATDAFGCSDTATLNVRVVNDSLPVYVPTAFTPNGDGKNDFFSVETAARPSDFGLRVYNRWGQTVFETADQGAKWNGRVKSQPALPGVYVWTLEYLSGKGCGRKQTSGTVLLIR